jgi:hypothetical protein
MCTAKKVKSCDDPYSQLTMLILLPVGLLLLGSLAIFILDLTRPKFGTSWLIASGTSIIAWVIIFYLRLRLPTQWVLLAWDGPTTDLFGRFSLLLDYDSWPYALALITITLAVILTDAARTRYDSTPRAWSACLIIAAFGLLAILSGTSLTMMVAWVLLDLLEIYHLLRLQDTTQFNFRIVISYGVRTASLLLLFWGTVQGWAGMGDFDLTQIPQNAGFIFLLAAGLRLGVFPLNLPFLREPVLRRGAGNLIRMMPVAASLSLLARLPVDLLTPNLARWMPLFMGLLALAALYAASRWLTADDEIEGRPYWIVAWASFATACVLNGLPQASIAWGIALILPGSLLFLYHPRVQRINFLLFFGIIGLLGLPYTPAASGWGGLVANGVTVWTLLFIIAHGLMVLGYMNRALRPGGEVGALESWARLVFPLGLILIIQSMIALGLVGWPGALTLGVWWPPLVSAVLIISAVILVRRFGAGLTYFQLPASSGVRKVTDWLFPHLDAVFRLEWVYRVVWHIFNFLGRILNSFSALLEGEGGVLWTVLILVLLITLLTSAGAN